ncbi:MAG: head-tail adaptor protein [Chloroflexi bacterium]|nr:head-tail adaptor protein [Chloroflexota bacterium]
MLSGAELAAMRAAQEAALPETCTRLRPALADDGTGGRTAGPPSGETFACRLAPTGGREVEAAARLTSAVTYTVTLPAGADVRAEDTLAVGERRLEVIAVLGGGAWETARRVLCVEVG